MSSTIFRARSIVRSAIPCESKETEMKIEAVAVVALPSRRVPGFAATTQSASPGKTSVTTLLLLLHLPEQIRASTEQRTSV